MKTLKEYSLAIIASTRNNFTEDVKASERISSIYTELRTINDFVSPEVVYALLIEALEIKRVPVEEKESKLKEFAKTFSLKHSPFQLYCFPYAGGVASIYKDWGSYLPSNISVTSLEYPGRGEKFHQKCIQKLPELLDHLEEEILPKLQGNFAFFGHSLGALVSFELAKRFKLKYDLEPICLFLSACPPPLKIMTVASISHLNDQDFISKVESLNGLPKELATDSEFINSFLPVLRNDFALLDDYRSDQNYKAAFPIVVYTGREDPHVTAEDMKAWSHETTMEFSMHLFSGDHFYIRKPEDLLQNLKTQVEQYVSK